MREHLKKLTVKQIADKAGVSTATVDRIINGRASPQSRARAKVFAAIESLNGGQKEDTNKVKITKIAFILEAGPTFISLVEQAIEAFIATQHQGVEYVLDSITTDRLTHDTIADLIKQRADESDGIILMAADDPTINRAVNQAIECGTPIICLTSDLPKSNRTAYVGSNQLDVGATAGYLMGKMLPKIPGRILFVASAPYDCQLQREQGFRQVLRKAFPHLKIEESINSLDDSEHSYESMVAFLKENRHLDAVYNAAGGNRGIAKALKEFKLTKKVIFIGHEVSSHTKELLDAGEMDIVLSHEFYREVETAVELIQQHCIGKQVDNRFFPVSIFTPFTSL